MSISQFTETGRRNLKLMAAEYTTERSGYSREEPVVHLFCRDEEGNKHHLEVDGFYPYFYVRPEEFAEKRDDILNDSKVRYVEIGSDDLDALDDEDLYYYDMVHEVEEPVETLHDESLVKIVAGIPAHVGNENKDFTPLRKHFDETWEADVFFEQRFLISTGIKTHLNAPVGKDRIGVSEIEPIGPEEEGAIDVAPRLITLDIEVRSEGSVPDVGDAGQPVTAISAHDNYDDEYWAWVLKHDNWEKDPEHIDCIPDGLDDAQIDYYDHEGLMLDDFHDWVAEKSPDLMSGWNCIPEDSKVTMGNGEKKNISSVQIGDEIIGFEDGKTSVGKVTNKWGTGEKKVKKITTESGDTLSASNDHKVLVGNKEEITWKECSKIEEGEYLVIPTNYRVENKTELDEEFAYKAGLIASDGSFSEKEGVRFYNNRDELHDQFDGGEVSYSKDGNGAQRVLQTKPRQKSVEKLKSLGIPQGSKKDKEWNLSPVFLSDEDSISSFIAGVVDGDGTASNTVSIAAANESFRNWLVSLLKRVGIDATKGENSVFVSSGSIDDFKREILPYMNHTPKVSRIECLEESKSSAEHTVPEVFVTEGGPRCDKEGCRVVNDKIRRGINIKRWEVEELNTDYVGECEDFKFEKVVAIEDDGVEKSYDIETTVSSFIAEDKVVHNCNGFDFPYLINRSYEVNAYHITKWSPLDGQVRRDPTYTTRGNTPVVKGVELFDMYEAYEETQIHELRSYSLDYVAEKELGFGKEDMPDIDEAWENNPEQFIKYNIRDTEAVVEIENEKQIITQYDHYREVTGQLYTECHHAISLIDMLMLRDALGDGFALPTSTKPDADHYHGAKVFDPKPGKHENVFYPDLACFTEDHNVLTVSGPKKITDVSVGDVVYSINPETEAVEKKPVTNTYSYPEYNGETVKFEGTRVDFEVTPNHRMLYNDGEGLYFEDAGEFDGKRRALPNPSGGIYGDGIETFDITEYLDADVYDVRATYSEHGHSYRSKLPDGCEKKRANYHEGFYFCGKTFDEYKEKITELSEDVSLCHPSGGGSTFRPLRFDGDVFVEFLGWFISEGSTYYPEDENTAVVKVAQETYKDEVRECFNLLGTKYSECNGAFAIGSEIYADFLEQYCGEYSEEKRIPEFIFERASVEQKELLLETLIKGDGHGNTYYTSSLELADDVLRLGVECGKKVKKNYRRGNEYEITITETSDGITDTLHSKGSATNGVYCIEVADNNTMLVGRNGKFQWIGNSLYPNLFYSTNMSPETVIGTEEELEESEYTKADCHRVFFDPRDDKLKDESDDNPEEHEIPIYVLKPDVKEAFVRNSIESLIDMKYEYKGTDKYEAVKRVTNATYGVIGDKDTYGKGFRLFDVRIAEAITLAGRKVLEHTAESIVNRLQNNGYTDTKLIGGDTDSTMMSIPNMDVEPYQLEAAARGYDTHPVFEAAKYTNQTYDEFMQETFNIEEEHRMEVEIESYATACFFLYDFDADDGSGVKKRYSQLITWDEDDGVITDPEPKTKGFELVRSDSAPITAEAQEKVLEMILRQDDAKDAVFTYLEDLVEEMKNGNIDLERAAMPSAISSKPPEEYGTRNRRPMPHVRGAKYASKHIDGEDIGQGSKPLKFPIRKIVGNDYPHHYDAETAEDGDTVDYIAVEDVRNIPREFKIDWELQVEKVLRNPIEPILRTLGWDWGDVTSRGRQSGLDQFA